MRLLDVRLIASIGLATLLALGCNVGPDNSFVDLQPLVFPSEGRLGTGGWGSTAAVVVDSNYMALADDWEFHDLFKDRIKIMVSDPSPTPAWTDTPANVRQVFSLQTPPNSTLNKTKPGAAMTLVVFDLPDAASLNSPAGSLTVVLDILIDDVSTYAPRFIVTGEGGKPETFFDPSIFTGNINSNLQSQPMIRLRGKRLAGLFQPGMPKVGAIDFWLIYKPSCISAVRVYGATEGANSTALVGPAISYAGAKFARVNLIDPKGIQLAFLTGIGADETLAGEGPLIDIGLNLVAGSGCTASTPGAYAITNLSVSDLNGNQIISVPGAVEIDTVDAPSPTAALRSYKVDLPAPPGGGGGC